MARARRQSEDTSAELDMTPMLDIVFIMLIFFIVTSVFVREPGVEVERPEVANLKEVKPSILVAVAADNKIWINKRETADADLRVALEDLRLENPKADAIIQGDAGAKFSRVFLVMETLQELGVQYQYVSTLPK